MIRDVFYYGSKPNVHPRERFAENLEDARAKATTEHFWIINEFCDYRNFDWDFDFDFLPDDEVWTEDHNNVWPSQWQKDSGTWLCPKEYSDVTIYRGDVDPVQRKNVKSDNWVELDLIDHLKFDFSWHPDPASPPYIYKWGCKYFPAELKHVLEYRVPGATQEKYMNTVVELLPEHDRWEELYPVDHDYFDFTWRPSPLDPPYIYVWGNRHNPAQVEPTVTYTVPGATQHKYIKDTVAVTLPETDRWTIHHPIDRSRFDFSWRPNPKDPPYIYVWGNKHNQAEIEPTVTYTVPGATDYKYINHEFAYTLPETDKWTIYYPIDERYFDLSWRPNPHDPPYIYRFGSDLYPGEVMPVLDYTVEGATDYKYVDIKVKLIPDMNNWIIPDNIDTSSFDFGWHPNPTSPPYIYEFATLWNNRGGPCYVVPGATDYKYIDDIKAKTLPILDNWEIPEGVDVSMFDFRWVPHPQSPPYIYQFGTKLDNNDGPRYVTPNNNGEVVYLKRVELLSKDEIKVGQYYIQTTLEDLVSQHPDEIFWALRKNIDYSKFDFTWRPGTIEVAWELNYVHVFGSMDSELTQTYFVSGKNYMRGQRDFKFVATVDLDEATLSNIFVKPDMFFVDRGNPESATRFEELKERFGDKIQKTRYINSWIDTINRCTNKATTELAWILNSELDYTDFTFDYYPNPWQIGMVQVFGTQWSHWGTTFMVNTETFAEDTKYIKIIEHLPNLNFVKTIRAKATSCIHDVAFIDHGNNESAKIKEALEEYMGREVVTVKYNKSYLNTIKELLHLLPQKKEHYVWVCSSVCDYSQFDFTYICDPFSRDNLHVFPSDSQKFGDTFFLDVNHARSLLETMDNLEKHPGLNFNRAIKADRLPAPVIVVEDDTHTSSLSKIEGFPYATLVTEDNVDIEPAQIDPMNLWSVETKNIMITSTGASRIVAPIEAKDKVYGELYDYPYIKRAPKLTKSNPIDIVFLSNGETGAEENYEHLLKVAENLPNRVVRVDGVNGRVAAYHAAAEASNTPWFFTVFAKLKVNSKFDWSWQPDRMQVPKHYIFHAKNPVNGLVYGHQAMIAYNKKLTLGNEGRGLDFTLDDAHEVVPLNSGTAHYNTDPYSTWRTAFRETIKLILDDSDDSKERLNAWLNKAEGDFAEYSIMGARDAELYFNEVEGDFNKLKLSYEWAWLRDRFENK